MAGTNDPNLEAGNPNLEGARNLDNGGTQPYRTGTPGSARWKDYALVGLACVTVGFVIYFISNRTVLPEGGPDQQVTAQGELPEGHPSTNIPPELLQRVEQLEAQVQANPDDPKLHLALGNALYDVERFDQAVAHYQIYLKSNPDDLDARTDMAFSLYRVGQEQPAIAELRDIIAENPKHQNATFNLGMFYLHQSQTDRQAIDSFVVYMEKTIAIDSTSQAGGRATEFLRTFRESHP